jgi:perosamine synthetase
MSYRNQGRGDGEEWHEYIRLGYNYRITDIQCALGISQLKKISTILEKREKVAAEYAKRLGKINGIKLPFDSTKDLKVSWFVYVIQIDSSENKEVFMQELKKRGVECSAYFQPIHLMKFYKEEFGFKQGDFPVCESIAKTTIALPFYTSMKTEDIDYVCKQVTEVQDYLTKTMKK